MMSAGAAARNYLEFGVKKSVLKVAARSLSAVRRSWADWRPKLGLGPSKAFERSRYGVNLRANWKDRTFQYCLYGTYGRELSDLVSLQRRPFIFLDIGANQGLFSLIAAKNPACAAVLAFEPVSRTFDLLRENIEENGLAARITAIRAAISNEAGQGEIAISHAHSGSASLRGSAEDMPSEPVQLLSYVELDSIPLPDQPIVAKVDVEGHELVVITELMRSRHFSRVKAIFYEIDERWVDPGAVRSMLEQQGFDRFTKFGVGWHYDMLAERS